MKSSNNFRFYLALLATLAVSGCGQQNPAQSSGTTQDPVASVPVAERVDAALGKYHPDPQQTLAPVDYGFYSLKRVCSERGGTFDESSQECICAAGGLFTTGTDVPGCAAITATESGLTLLDSSGVYQSIAPNDFGLFFSSVPDGHLAHGSTDTAASSKPFRLSFYGHAVIPVQHPDFGYQGLSDHWLVIEGQPFQDASWNYPLYEPDSQFVLAALQLNATAMSIVDETRFSSLVMTPTYDVAKTTKAALLSAYQAFRNTVGFQPTSVLSSYSSGCASYCVASEPLPSSDPGFVISFKKVYQLGTPSARLIVVQSSRSSKVIGVISLNVAQTVSTVTIAKEAESIQGAGACIPLTSYDRYGTMVDLDFDCKNDRPFEHLLK